MQVTLPLQIVLLKRGETSKTPLMVAPHEVEILRSMHGEDSIQLTDEESPVAEMTFETEDEYSRCEQYYKGNAENSNPTRLVFRNLEEFEAAFSAKPAKTRKNKVADDLDAE